MNKEMLLMQVRDLDYPKYTYVLYAYVNDDTRVLFHNFIEFCRTKGETSVKVVFPVLTHFLEANLSIYHSFVQLNEGVPRAEKILILRYSASVYILYVCIFIALL